MRRTTKRPGQHAPQAEQAANEQLQADAIVRRVAAVEHYLYLKNKFGPRGEG